MNEAVFAWSAAVQGGDGWGRERGLEGCSPGTAPAIPKHGPTPAIGLPGPQRGLEVQIQEQ